MYRNLKSAIIFFIAAVAFLTTPSIVLAQTPFRFASLSDAHTETTNFTSTFNQVKSLNPNFIIFSGDVENNGVVATEMDSIINIIGDWLTKTFIVRGNHDDHLTNSISSWQNYFTGKYGATRVLPSGASNYVSMNTNNFLNYSFDFGNSRFIGLDSNTNGNLTSTNELTFLDTRLTDAENRGLTHAFIYFHPPAYCVGSTHCSCQTKTGCGPSSQFVNIINKHPIVSATFHGHEHILAWVHMDSTRITGLTHPYEEFITSSAGEPYGFTPYPARMDYYNYSSSLKAFGVTDVDGKNFTVSFYHTGTTNPIWSQTFTKNSPAPSPTPTGSTNKRIMNYYLADRVRSNSDFAKLASFGINTAVVDFKVGPNYGESTSVWDARVNAAAAAGINIVIWPDGHGGGDVNGCRWETPFDDGSIGSGADYLVNIKTILDRYGNNPHVIGIVTAHEPVWVNSGDQDRCSETIADMTKIKTQIHNYINNTVHRDSDIPPFKVWNYIDNIYNIENLNDYSSTNKKSQIEGIMDVAVIWQHCAGYPNNQGDGSPCEGSSQYTALGGINYDRNTMIKNNGLEGIIEEAFLIQTFNQGTNGDYGGIFTPNDLQKYSCDFLNTDSLDGFGYYTWDEGWYTGNLKSYLTSQPSAYTNVLNYIYANCIKTPYPSTPPDKPADINGDGKINIIDIGIIIDNYGKDATFNRNADVNKDGIINIIDIGAVLDNYEP